nr:RNA-directed DNA polymerase, eukaryota [Tanacetum cinerariifolium]
MLDDSNAMIHFKKKLQCMKKAIRLWVTSYKRNQTCNVREIKQRLHDIDIELDQGGVNNEILLDRKDLLKQLQDIKALESIDYAQKAKIQWAIEGDKNSKFYHGIINRKRANLSIKGIMVDGEWVDDPLRVKAEFCNHFSKRFQVPGSARGHLNFLFLNRLSQEQADDLEILISRDEIRAAVWDCGLNKSPGPDGFTFEFFQKYWNIVGVDFCEAVECDFRPICLIGCLYKVVTKVLASHLAVVISDIVSDVQSAFIPNRQILDGPFIINEVLSWCKCKKQQVMIFKADFAKAYDSVRATEAGIFKGLQLDPSLTISHLFYADDAVFIVEWSDLNITRIVHILHCFSLASGLKINLLKSHILGVGVHQEKVNDEAVYLGCSVMRTPFKYLGVPIG